ncbi:unnamed protein product [Amoebophrya sp. A120]|nr:unnamed protein product [Amoebophrya sp. A120]|eukprot:GSA120T00024370001.1
MAGNDAYRIINEGNRCTIYRDHSVKLTDTPWQGPVPDPRDCVAPNIRTMHEMVERELSQWKRPRQTAVFTIANVTIFAHAFGYQYRPPGAVFLTVSWLATAAKRKMANVLRFRDVQHRDAQRLAVHNTRQYVDRAASMHIPILGANATRNLTMQEVVPLVSVLIRGLGTEVAIERGGVPVPQTFQDVMEENVEVPVDLFRERFYLANTVDGIPVSQILGDPIPGRERPDDIFFRNIRRNVLHSAARSITMISCVPPSVRRLVPWSTRTCLVLSSRWQ